MRNKYIKELPRATVIALVVFLIIVFIGYSNGQKITFDSDLMTTFLYTLLYSMSLHLANTFLFIKLDDIYKNDRFARKRIIIGFFASFLLSVSVIFLLRFLIIVLIENETVAYFFKHENMRDYFLPIVFTFIIILIIHLIHLYKSYQDNKITEQKIIATTASAKFESLKNQIDPHFLFNSLNVLNSLIEENPENAQKFTTSLSKVYRYVLEQKDKDLVTIAEELSFAKTFMNLLKMRFEDSLTYELPENEYNTDDKVVPLSLQLLLENTVKHNIVSEQKPLHIKIYIENNYLCVQNNLQKKQVLQNQQGVGIQNIVSRYGLISKRKIAIEQTETYFKVKLPILTKQSTVMETSTIYSENNAYQNAKERVEILKDFYGSLISFCIVIPVLIFINLKYSGNYQWFWFPLFGWGFGLTVKGLKAFGVFSNWEERKIQQIMDKGEKY